MEVDERDPLDDRRSQPDIVTMSWGLDEIIAPVAVAQKAVRPKLVFVGPLPSRDNRCRRDAQGEVTNGRLEDPLRPLERDTLTLEDKSASQGTGRKHLTVEVNLLLEELEGGESNASVPGLAVHVMDSSSGRDGMLRKSPG